MRLLIRQFSTPGRCSQLLRRFLTVEVTLFDEGGELGYSRFLHAFGAAFKYKTDLVVACVIGDGEAETGPLAGSWKGSGVLESST